MPSKIFRGTLRAFWSSFAALLTTVNTYVDYGVVNTHYSKTTRFRFVASGQNLHVQILGSFDDGVTYPVTVLSQTTVTTATPIISSVTDYYTNLKVQVKPAVNDVHGTLNCQFASASI